MNKNWILSIICTAFALLVLTTNTNAQVVVFSNDFEDGDLDPEIGSVTLVAESSTTAVVPVAGGADGPLGSNVGLYDQGTIALDMTLNLTDPVSLADGNTVTLDFDVAARRTNGISRTIRVDAVDSNGNIVVRFILGDNNFFGNGESDRQRPGFSTLADGNSTFGTPPGSFWYGADTNPFDFNANVVAPMSLTIGESTFDFSTTRAFSGPEFSVTGVSNFDTVASANIAEIRLTSFEPELSNIVIYGVYLDNIQVEGVVAEVVEPDVLKGDADLSEAVDFADIPAFIDVLISGEFQAESDADCSGEVDFADIPAFIAILIAQ